jgi:hypothetical protein
MNKRQYIIAFALLAVWFISAVPALRGELKVLAISPEFMGMDYDEKKYTVEGGLYGLGLKVDSIIPSTSSVLFVNLAKTNSIPFFSYKVMYYVSPRSLKEVRSLDALSALRVSDYDHIVFHAATVTDAVTFNREYPKLKRRYSDRTGSGFYAIFEPDKGGAK